MLKYTNSIERQSINTFILYTKIYISGLSVEFVFFCEQEFDLIFYTSNLCFFRCEFCCRLGVLDFYFFISGNYFLCEALLIEIDIFTTL